MALAGITIISTCISYHAFAEQEVTITVTPQFAKHGDDLLIYASLPSYAKPDDLRYFIDIFDPEGRKVDSTLWFAREDFNYTLRTEHPAFNITRVGDYTISVEKGFNIYRTGEIVKTISFTIITNPSPLKQIKAGTQPHNVACNSGLELAQKKGGETSACVKLDTKIELTVRGWAEDDRVILGCIGERYSICYPEDKSEYRKLLQKYYYGFDGVGSKIQNDSNKIDSKDNATVSPLEIKVKGEKQVRRGTIYSIEITGLKDSYIIGEPYSFSYILYGFGSPCGGIWITYPINKTNSLSTGWIPSCLKTNPTDFVLDVKKTYGTTYGHVALQELGNYTIRVQFEKGINGPTVAEKNFTVINP